MLFCGILFSMDIINWVKKKFPFCNQMPSAFTNLFFPYGLIEQNHLFKLRLPFASQNLNLIIHLYCLICFQWLKSIGSKCVYHFCNQMLSAFTIMFCPCVLIEQTHLFNLCLPCSSQKPNPIIIILLFVSNGQDQLNQNLIIICLVKC